jgi:hypothetical protein
MTSSVLRDLGCWSPRWNRSRRVRTNTTIPRELAMPLTSSAEFHRKAFVLCGKRAEKLFDHLLVAEFPPAGQGPHPDPDLRRRSRGGGRRRAIISSSSSSARVVLMQAPEPTVAQTVELTSVPHRIYNQEGLLSQRPQRAELQSLHEIPEGLTRVGLLSRFPPEGSGDGVVGVPYLSVGLNDTRSVHGVRGRSWGVTSAAISYTGPAVEPIF